MKRKSVKLLSLLLALVMCFSALPVFQLEAEAATLESKWLWPVPDVTTITKGRQYSSGHKGIDVNAAKGKTVVASKSGTVYKVFTGCNNWSHNNGTCKSYGRCTPNYDKGYKENTMCNYGFGRGVIIKHSDNTYSQYAHMSTVDVKEGQSVKQGDKIGTVGAYGNAYGAHLHFSLSRSTWGSSGKFSNNPKHLGYSDIDYILKIDTITKPATPSISSNVSGDIALNKPVTVSWGKISGATGYKVNINGSQVTTTTATSYSFKASEAKKYEITVSAYNSKYTSSASNKITLTAHNPLNVTFVNYDGSPLTADALSVDYGANVIAPEIPAREGYTFTGWDKALTNIKADTVITAQYKINTYTVKFIDSKGKELSSQKVEYSASAVEPEDKEIPAGYKFIGWSTQDYLNVKEDLTVYGVYEWANKNLPVVIENVTALRQDDGYEVNINIKNGPEKITRGRAVVALKTADGKLIYTTESAAFSVQIDKSKALEVFVPCEKSATKAEVIIVDSYMSGVPISSKADSEIENGLSWSDWSETPPEDGTYTEIQEKTQYRYKDKQFSTASTSTKDGWTYYKTTSTTSSGSTTSKVTAFSNESQTRTVTTRKVNNYSTRTVYNYNHYLSKDKTKVSPIKYNGYTLHETTQQTRLKDIGESSVGGTIYGCSECAKCKAVNAKNAAGKIFNQWYNEEKATEKYVSSTTTYYDYKDTFYTYHFYQWKDWSEWSDDAVTANDDREVETRTVYRYRGQFADAGTEDTEGVTRTVSGKLGAGLGGKEVILFVYKVDDASDYTNEYVGQQVTSTEDGSYSFTFKLREEPSVKTGDYTIALGIEGTNERMVVGKIEAPKPVYKVNFYNDGAMLGETQLVEEGKAAVLPENPVREGCTFVGWSADTSNVHGDITAEALFVENKYTVVFVDFVNQTVNVKEFKHGAVLTPPEMKSVEGYTFTGWEELTGDDYVVTENMVLTADYQKDMYTVEFYDFDNNLIDTQYVYYGEAANEPEAPEEENMSFIDWDSNEDYTNVTDNITVNAVYVYNETCEMPYADVKTGEYAETKTVTLNCDTENAVIFYTTDGSEPTELIDGDVVKVYTKPITIDKSTVLKFYAAALNMNESEVVTETYAVNNGNTESGLMIYEDIPEIVMNNLDKYSLKSTTGYRYKNVLTTDSISEAENLTQSGWTLSASDYSEWSDWSMTKDAPKGVVSEYREQDPAPVDTPFYRYSHWKYNNGEDVLVSPTEVAGTDGEWEYVELESSLSITSFVSSMPAYDYNGEKWFSQTIVTKGVVPDYKLYSYRTMTNTFFRWTDWTATAPEADETRETENATVFYYSIPVMHVVTVHTMDEGADDFSVFAYDGAIVDLGDSFYNTEGYEIGTWYLNEEKTATINLEETPITASIDVYPEYIAKKFGVVFKNYDGTVISEQTVEYCEDAVEPEVNVPDGMVFVGWDSLDFTSVCADAVITAVVKPENEIVTVYLNKEKINLYIDSMLSLKAYTNTENAPLKWTSSNYDVADVDDNGLVTAISEGTAVITVTTADNMTASCTVSVESDVLTKITFKSDAGIGFDNLGYIRGIKEKGNTVNEISAKFENSELIFKSFAGDEISGEDLIGTGSTVEISVNDILIDSHTFIITGDVNCDGKIGNRDVAYVTRYLVNKESADFEYQLIALDTNGDGNVNNRDAAMLARYLVGKETI